MRPVTAKIKHTHTIVRALTNHRSRISRPSLNRSEPKAETAPEAGRRSAAPRSLTGTT